MPPQVIRQGHGNHVLHLRIREMRRLLDGHNASSSRGPATLRSKGIGLCSGAAAELVAAGSMAAEAETAAAGPSANTPAAAGGGSSSNAAQSAAAQQQQQQQQQRVMAFDAARCRWYYEDDLEALEEVQQAEGRVQVGSGTSVHPKNGFRVLGQDEVRQVIPGLRGSTFDLLPDEVVEDLGKVDEERLEQLLDVDPARDDIVHRKQGWPMIVH
jgi:hypothetical protein